MRMKGKICVVTGGSSGVGKAIAKGLAELGAQVIIVSKNKEKAEKVIQDIIRSTKNTDICWMYADLSSQQSIRDFVKEFKKKYNYLNILSNNAGIIQLKREDTVDGIERTFAVDYLCHFLLTNLLVDLLKKGAPSRVLTVAGGKQLLQKAKFDFEDIQLRKKFNGFKAAIQAALARVIFTKELAEKLKYSGINCYSFQPGMIKSDLGNKLPFFLRISLKLIRPFFSKKCETALYLSTSDEVEDTSGGFYKKKRELEFTYTDETGKKLWEISENLTNCANF